MTPYDAAEWHELLVAAAGAAAALAGLVFVAVSINVERILKYEGLPERALATLVLLLAVLVVSLLGLAPDQTPVALGAELIGAGVVAGLAAISFMLRPQENRDGSRAVQPANVAVAAAGTLPYAVAGASLILGGGGGLYWLLAGMIMAIVGAVANAWVFLVEILR